ncbi:uncharacterized protein TNIN_182331 [Trichonephila inaurata madagascariensis]|uniref:Reverse transcriptase domain-containing protein n=1 Tax=Trichonephila inaurata madagascariensis TaxID=2747483 RepID=A0A8X6IG67_9ARAC|nr:uncharacterized protein TNIN_182331 [Trichonephila inaurata madagascariensis]
MLIVSEFWFSPVTDSRGIKLYHFFSMWHLFTINEDYGPTFSANLGTSYIDITAVWHNVFGLIEKWFIPECDSLSDHRMISYELKIPKSERACDCSVETNLFNTKRANWNMFHSHCSKAKNAILGSLNNCIQPDSLKLCVQDNVWKKIYTHGVKTNFAKRLEISGIEVSSGHFTTTFEDTIDAILRKSFSCDPNSQDNSQLWFYASKVSRDLGLPLRYRQRGKTQKLCDFLISLDIKGAFDNAWWPGILHMLKSFKVPKNIFCLIQSFLQCRSADLTLSDATKNCILEKGCLQGSVMEPFLLNLFMNDLLCNISKFQNCHKIAFADDSYCSM